MEVLPDCKYGDKCFRKNAEHIKNYRHRCEGDVKKDESESSIVPEAPAEKADNVESRRESLEKNSNKRIKLSDETASEQNENIDGFDLTAIGSNARQLLKINMLSIILFFYLIQFVLD